MNAAIELLEQEIEYLEGRNFTNDAMQAQANTAVVEYRAALVVLREIATP